MLAVGSAARARFLLLHRLTAHSPALTAPYHRELVDLYIDHEPRLLYGFMTSLVHIDLVESTFDHRAAAERCKAMGLMKELSLIHI